MKTKPILCNTEVVKNILAGRQTQDRRPIKPQPIIKKDGRWRWNRKAKGITRHGPNIAYMLKELPACAPHQPGDVLYVQEKTQIRGEDECKKKVLLAHYGDDSPCKWTPLIDEEWEKWTLRKKPFAVTPSIHMPKWAARIFLRVTGVRVERIQDISDDDAFAEGIEEIGGQKFHGNIWKMVYKSFDKNITCCSPSAAFETLWNSLYPGSWDRNDWVWVTDFEMCGKPQ